MTASLVPSHQEPRPSGIKASAGGLLREGGSLSFAVGLSAALGALTWVVAARFATPEAVGQASVIVSAMLFASTVGQSILTTSLFRWLPRAAGATRRLLRTAMLFEFAVAGSVALVLTPLVWHNTGSSGALLFWAATASWALFSTLSPMQAALGRATVVPLQEGVFAVLRLSAIPVLATAGVLGLVGAWILPALALGLLIGGLIWRCLPPSGPGRVPTRAELRSFAGPAWAGHLIQLVGWHVVPLMVTAAVGAATGAVFYVLWTLINAVELATQQFGASMIVRSSHDPGRLRDDARLATRVVFGVGLPGLAVGIATAGWLLSVFGPHYVSGSATMRILLVGMAARAFVIVAITARAAAGHTVPTLLAHLLQTTATLTGFGLGLLTGNVLTLVAVGYSVGAWVSLPAAGVLLARTLRHPERTV